MATLQQKKAAENTVKIVRSGVKTTKGELVKSSGYSDDISRQPKRVLESKGYKEELAKYGLTEELIASALVADINKLPSTKRLDHLKFGAELTGMTKKAPQNAFQFNFSDDKRKYS